MENQENKKLTRKEKKALKKQNRTSADKKGMLLVVALAAVALALFVNAVSLYNDGADVLVTVPTSNQNVVTIAPSTTETTQPIQTTVPPTTDNQQTTASTTEKEDDELSKSEILQKVGEGINFIKDYKGTVIAKKTQNINLTLTDCSLPAFVGIVNKVLEIFAGETVTEYVFNDGKAVDSKGNELTLYGAIPPSNRYFELTQEGMADAKVTKDGENTVYTIVVVPETSTMADPRPPFHSMAGDTFDCTKVELPVGEITKADFDYPGAEISITVTPDGKVVRYFQVLRINGVGGGAAFGMSADGRIEGKTDELWEFTY